MILEIREVRMLKWIAWESLTERRHKEGDGCVVHNRLTKNNPTAVVRVVRRVA